MRGIKFGWLSGFGALVGVVGLCVCAVAALGVAMEWEIEFSGTELPDTWGGVAGLAAAVGLILILSIYGAFMRMKFQAAKGKPAVRLALVIIGVGLLVLAGRGVQVMALTMSYGSMLAYYATDGDLDDVKAELADNPKPEHLDAAVSRAAQYGNVEALKLLLAAGADFRDASETNPERQYCALKGRKVQIEFLKVALESGVTPATCPRSEDLIKTKVRGGQDDAKVAEIVTLLRKAGWDPKGVPADNDQAQLAVDYARQRKWPLTIAALEAP